MLIVFLLDPSDFPANVVSMTLSSTAIRVTWDPVPPIHQNGIITMYEVLYQPLETFGGAIQTLARNLSGTEMSVDLADLQEFFNYSISVRSFTSVGDGPYSEQDIIMTDEDSKLNIMVSWIEVWGNYALIRTSSLQFQLVLLTM